jgi:hypothetical protein
MESELSVLHQGKCYGMFAICCIQFDTTRQARLVRMMIMMMIRVGVGGGGGGDDASMHAMYDYPTSGLFI